MISLKDQYSIYRRYRSLKLIPAQGIETQNGRLHPLPKGDYYLFTSKGAVYGRSLADLERKLIFI